MIKLNVSSRFRPPGTPLTACAGMGACPGFMELVADFFFLSTSKFQIPSQGIPDVRVLTPPIPPAFESFVWKLRGNINILVPYRRHRAGNVPLGGCFAGGSGGIVEQPGCVLSAKILFGGNKTRHLDPKTHPWARELLLKNWSNISKKLANIDFLRLVDYTRVTPCIIKKSFSPLTCPSYITFYMYYKKRNTKKWISKAHINIPQTSRDRLRAASKKKNLRTQKKSPTAALFSNWFFYWYVQQTNKNNHSKTSQHFNRYGIVGVLKCFDARWRWYENQFYHREVFPLYMAQQFHNQICRLGAVFLRKLSASRWSITHIFQILHLEICIFFTLQLHSFNDGVNLRANRDLRNPSQPIVDECLWYFLRCKHISINAHVGS